MLKNGLKSIKSISDFVLSKKILVILILAIAAIVPRSIGLSEHYTIDEQNYFYEGRIAQAVKALAQRDFAGTFVTDKPAITNVIFQGPGYIINRILQENYGIDSFKVQALLLRIPQVIVAAACIILCYFIFKKIFNAKIAFFISILVAVEPMLTGVTQIVNPDAFVAYFGLLSMALVLYYAETDKGLIWLSLSTALMLLAKYSGSILLYYFLLAFFLFFFVYKREKLISVVYRCSTYLVYTWCFMILLWPATWINMELLFKSSLLPFIKSPYILYTIGLPFIVLIPVAVAYYFILKKYKKTDDKLREGTFPYIKQANLILKTIAAIFLVSLLLPGGGIFTSQTQGMTLKELIYFNYDFLPDIFKTLLVNLNTLKTGISLFIFTFMVFETIYLILNFDIKKKELVFRYFIFCMIPAFYIACMARSQIAGSRYQIFTFFAADSLAVLGIYDVFKIKIRKFRLNVPEDLYKAVRIVALTAAIAGSVFNLAKYIPFTYFYRSVIDKNVVTEAGWGFGSYQAAEYINSVELNDNIIIYADYWTPDIFFSEDTTILGRSSKDLYSKGTGYDMYAFAPPDYFIEYSNGSKYKSTLPRHWTYLKISEALENREPQFLLKKEDTEIVSVYKTPAHFIETDNHDIIFTDEISFADITEIVIDDKPIPEFGSKYTVAEVTGNIDDYIEAICATDDYETESYYCIPTSVYSNKDPAFFKLLFNENRKIMITDKSYNIDLTSDSWVYGVFKFDSAFYYVENSSNSVFVNRFENGRCDGTNECNCQILNDNLNINYVLSFDKYSGRINKSDKLAVLVDIAYDNNKFGKYIIPITFPDSDQCYIYNVDFCKSVNDKIISCEFELINMEEFYSPELLPNIINLP